MPTYEYRCKTCGEHLEVVQSFTDDPLTRCPGCDGELRKVFSPIGIAFKGSGFYRTDSRAAAKATSGNGSSAARDANGAKDAKGSKETRESSGSSTSRTSDSASSSSTGSEAKSA